MSEISTGISIGVVYMKKVKQEEINLKMTAVLCNWIFYASKIDSLLQITHEIVI